MIALPEKYQDIVNSLKEKIRQASYNAIYTVNIQLLSIYWEIGKTILDQQVAEGWGTKVIDRLSLDLKEEFPDMKGLSVRNIKYMRSFAEAYPDFFPSVETQSNEFVQAPLAQLPGKTGTQNVQAALAQLSWYHHITLLDKVKDPGIRYFYIKKTIENGWSRNVMVHQIESGLHKRSGSISNNFRHTIAPPDSELVRQVFKDPYKFDFIYLGKEATERDLEDALTTQLKNFLLELGQWFAFMGRQYRITLGSKEYFFDLLFYHTRLKRYIVVDLKIDEFKPEYKGKMDFYLNLADEKLKSEFDEPSIGLILCKTKDGLVAEYALRDSSKPIGIAEYQIQENLSNDLKRELPSVEELESEMEREIRKFNRPGNIEKYEDELLPVETENETNSKVSGIYNVLQIPGTMLVPGFSVYLLKIIHKGKKWFYIGMTGDPHYPSARAALERVTGHFESDPSTQNQIRSALATLGLNEKDFMNLSVKMYHFPIAGYERITKEPLKKELMKTLKLTDGYKQYRVLRDKVCELENALIYELKDKLLNKTKGKMIKDIPFPEIYNSVKELVNNE